MEFVNMLKQTAFPFKNIIITICIQFIQIPVNVIELIYIHMFENSHPLLHK